jgi:hypothetical protein
VDSGLAVIERVLDELGMRRPRGNRQTLLSIAGGRALIRVIGLRYVRREESRISRQELARVDTTWSIACALSVIDVLQGAEFQNRHLVRALRAGEPRRLLRALTLEISFAATPGAGSERRTARLLEVASSLVGPRSDGGAMGLFHLAQGIAAYLRGENERALERCQSSLQTLTNEGARAVWEMVTARRFAIAAMFFLGRTKQLSAFVPPLVTEAETTGNVYAGMVYLAGYSTVAWLTRDDAGTARENLALVLAQWPGQKYRLSHYNVLVGEVFTELYEGDGLRARALLREQWQRISEAQLHRVEVLRVQLLHFRAATACAAARALLRAGKRVEAAAMQVEARYFATRLRRCASPRAEPLALLVCASLDALTGNARRATDQLLAASAQFDAQGLALFSAASRIQRGRISTGGARDELERAGLAAFTREGVVAPERMLRLLAPGFGEG